MKFEETLSPTLYNVHYYMPTKKETLINKAQNKKEKKSKIRKPSLDKATANADLSAMTEEFAASAFAATGKGDVLGVQQRIPDDKKIVRRKFPKPVALSRKKKRRKK